MFGKSWGLKMIRPTLVYQSLNGQYKGLLVGQTTGLFIGHFGSTAAQGSKYSAGRNSDPKDSRPVSRSGMLVANQSLEIVGWSHGHLSSSVSEGPYFVIAACQT